MKLTTPDKCPGHRFPGAEHLRNMPPGTPIQCIWCDIVVDHKKDPRWLYGARTVDANFRLVL